MTMIHDQHFATYTMCYDEDIDTCSTGKTLLDFTLSLVYQIPWSSG